MPRQYDWIEVTVRGLEKKYKLPQPFMALLERLWHHKKGTPDPSALGRLMRVSEHMRTTCTDTIAQLAQAIQTSPDPTTIKECTSLIGDCAELLAMANEPSSKMNLPFMKLPAELRNRVYRYYFSELFDYRRDRLLYMARRVEGCYCIPMFDMPMKGYVVAKIDLPLSRVCKALRDEVLPAWYGSTNSFVLNCTFETEHFLTRNKSMAHNLRSLSVHWSGPDAAEAFKLLGSVPLKELIVVISKSTTNHLSEREAALQEYLAHKGPRRLSDAAGFEELYQLRGLDIVAVRHINKIQGYKRTDQERIELQGLLDRYLLLSK